MSRADPFSPDIFIRNARREQARMVLERGVRTLMWKFAQGVTEGVGFIIIVLAVGKAAGWRL
jgi:hypothetical protein